MSDLKLKSIVKATILLGFLCSCSLTQRVSPEQYEGSYTEIGKDGVKVTGIRYPVYVSLLEDYLQNNRYDDLSNALFQEESNIFKANAKLNWEKDKVFAGASNPPDLALCTRFMADVIVR